jgi:hypothetical protein
MGVPGNANALLLASAAVSGGYQVSRSLRFNSADSSFLSRTPASAGNRKTWTWAGWVKRSGLDSFQKIFGNEDSSELNGVAIQFRSDNSLHVYDITSSVQWQKITTAVYRDPSSWYHLVVAVDTTNGTAGDRVKIYINGVRETSFSTSSDPSPSADTQLNTTTAHGIGRSGAYNGSYFNGYLADIYFIDGQALTPSSFAETDATTGQLIPKAYSGSYGSNGWKLSFSDNSTTAALGTDTSSNGNTWTTNNFSVTAGSGNDSLVDTPTSYGTDTGVGGEVRGNYCTWNPLNKNSALTLANGNLDTSNSPGGSDGLVLGTIGAATGKYYWEVTVTSVGTGRPIIGVVPTAAGLVEVGSGNANSVGYRNTGIKRINGSDTSYGNSYTTGDVIGVALDLDNGAIYFSKNNTWQNSGVPTSGASKTGAAHTWTGGSVEMTPGISEYAGNCSTNWGARAFAYTAPSGFKALNTANLPAPVVAKPNTVFNVALWTGNGTSQTISGLNFSPDFVWTKNRIDAQVHGLFDQVRGADLWLSSNLTDAETNYGGGFGVTAFTSTGFTVGNGGALNRNGDAIVGWAWDAGTSTVTNTAGSISSQVRANASAGFSVVTYTANGSNTATIGHGLGVKPSLIIHKQRTKVESWRVYHISRTSTGQFLTLNGTGAFGSSSDIYPAEPTSTVFTPGNEASMNSGTENCVAYCFAPVSGYSSFGSYTGNGSSDGPFVFTGMRPRWIVFKQTNVGGQGWFILDTARSAYNVASTYLLAQSSNAEASGYVDTDFCSNGFKIRSSDGAVNASGGTYIYAAFAESPFQYARAR